ncbi:hypothetical protein MTR67_003932 [Solanum verrucosum]|uniref:Uncharacterized protein n=1 Tax=Solanum verrucosum TaxID=315347 RepID=A0AAF0PTN4_SOLVR|nr:hypothetical protein MTR67_003932 [Solanum verrucosum]
MATMNSGNNSNTPATAAPPKQTQTTAKTVDTQSVLKRCFLIWMSGDSGISAFPEEDNIFCWKGTITGRLEVPPRALRSGGASGHGDCNVSSSFGTTVLIALVLRRAIINASKEIKEGAAASLQKPCIACRAVYGLKCEDFGKREAEKSDECSSTSFSDIISLVKRQIGPDMLVSGFLQPVPDLTPTIPSVQETSAIDPTIPPYESSIIFFYLLKLFPSSNSNEELVT